MATSRVRTRKAKIVATFGTASTTKAAINGGAFMIQMPDPDQGVLARRAEIVAALREIVPGEGVIDSDDERRAYEMRRADRLSPAAAGRGAAGHDRAGLRGPALLPRATGVKVVPRGAGTSLSGGALPLADGVLLGLGKFNRILEIDYRQPLRRGAAGRHQSRHHPGGRRPAASTTRPIRPARSPAPSAATSRRIPAACIA